MYQTCSTALQNKFKFKLNVFYSCISLICYHMYYALTHYIALFCTKFFTFYMHFCNIQVSHYISQRQPVATPFACADNIKIISLLMSTMYLRSLHTINHINNNNNNKNNSRNFLHSLCSIWRKIFSNRIYIRPR